MELQRHFPATISIMHIARYPHQFVMKNSDY
jgi:hypothetical protein